MADGALTVVLLGPSCTALYDATARSLRKGGSGAYRRYFDTLKNSFKTACMVGLLLGDMTLLFAGTAVLLWWSVLFLPYLWVRLACLLLERIFKPFMEEQGKTI